MSSYPATIERVIDADTLIARIDLGLNVLMIQKVRLAGLNAHERNTFLGQKASAYVRERLLHRPLRLEVPTKSFDKYGRVIATVWVNEENFNQELLDQGYAVPYDGRTPAKDLDA